MPSVPQSRALPKALPRFGLGMPKVSEAKPAHARGYTEQAGGPRECPNHAQQPLAIAHKCLVLKYMTKNAPSDHPISNLVPW